MYAKVNGSLRGLHMLTRINGIAARFAKSTYGIIITWVGDNDDGSFLPSLLSYGMKSRTRFKLPVSSPYFLNLYLLYKKAGAVILYAAYLHRPFSTCYLGMHEDKSFKIYSGMHEYTRIESMQQNRKCIEAPENAPFPDLFWNPRHTKTS